MLTRDRQGGSRNFVAGLFATFWVLLAVFSCAYLFRIVTEPSAPRADVDAAQASAVATDALPEVPPGAESPPPAVSGQEPSPLSADQAQALLDASAAKDQEIGELKTEIEAISQQVTDLNARLAPIEKVVGPVAALQPGAAVTTSPPQPQLPLVAPPEPVKPSSKAAAKAAERAKAAEKAPEPVKPPEPAKAPEPVKAPETATPPEQAAEAEPPAPPAQVKEPAKQPEAKAPEKPAEAPKPADKPSEAAAKPAEKPAQMAAISPSDAKPAPKAQGTPATPAPAESASPPAAPPAQTANLAPAIPIPPGTTRFGIEIGSVDKQESLRSLWKELLNNHAALVAGLQARRVLAPDKKWRLIAGPFPDVAEATQACGLFKKANLSCEATVFAGDSL